MKSNLSVLFFKDDVFCVLFKNSLPSPGSQARAVCPMGERRSGCHSWARVALNLQRQDSLAAKNDLAQNVGSAEVGSLRPGTRS